MKSEGSIIIAVIFIILVSFIGVSLLSFSYLHNKIEAARIKKVLETEKISHDLVYYLHQFREKLFAESFTCIADPETAYFNESMFPEQDINGTMIESSFSFQEIPNDYYKKTRIFCATTASAASNPYACWAEADIDIISGQIPLTKFPVFVNKKIDSSAATFLNEKNIISKDDKKIVVEEIETKFDMTDFLKDAVEIDRARALTWEEIREQFGFERSSEPIPEGVHILSGEDTVKLIFIQGDVEKIIFSVENNRQNIGIRQRGIDYVLSYEPGEYDFRCWENRIPEYSLFKEKIVVNGNAWSIEQSGEAAFLTGSNIVLFVSYLAVIRSNLETRGLNLRDIFLANLTLLSSSKNFPDRDNNLESGVVFDTGGEANIRASILTDEKVTNRCEKLHFSGSLYTTELENQGIIEVTHLDSKYDSGSYFATINFTYICNFFINFIEEVYNE